MVTAAVSSYFLPTFACLLATYQDGVRDYNGYQVLRVNITSSPVLEALKTIFFNDEYDFWSPPSMSAPTDILVAPKQLDTLKSILGYLGVPYDVMIQELNEAIETEKKFSRSDSSGMTWSSYHRLATIHAWMDAMAEEYPEIVTVETVGMSTEGRPMKVMKISSGGGGVGPGRNSSKPAIWIDGGIHAREWISPATTSCMANELIKEAVRGSGGERSYTDTFDWYFAPVLNPDGYEYTHTVDRLWRKTRSVPKRSIFESIFGCCKGVDPNRNWAYMWGGKGTSKNTCSQVYCGPSPASEPEVASIQNFVMSKKDDIKLFLTFHSYSQLLLLPWGHDQVRTDDHDEMMRVGNRALKKLQSVYGTEYKAGDTAEILYPAAGGSHDWAKGVAGIKYSYCYELRDQGNFGFLLPANQIMPSCKETLAAVKSMADDVAEVYSLTSSSSS